MIRLYKRVIYVLQSIILVAALISSICPFALAAENGASGNTLAIAAGVQHSLLLRSDGTVWTWGRNNYGQLGNGTTTNSMAPVQVSGLTGVKSISACENQSFAVKTDGTVWAWGQNNYGQLGDGTKTDRSAPVQITGLTDVGAIAAGPCQTFALNIYGTVRAWGKNTYGQLGDGTTIDRLTPVSLKYLYGVKAIATGGSRAYGDCHTLAIKTDDTVYAWGTNSCGELGDNTTANCKDPKIISGMTPVTAIAAGTNNSFALKSDGTVWAWGDNSYGYLGIGSTTPAKLNSPVMIRNSCLSNKKIVELKACGTRCLALTDNGEVYGWGNNGEGELGNGTYQPTFYSPVQTELEGAIALATGNNHALALKNDGTVWAWGFNSFGQLGDGTTDSSAMPVQVTLPAAQSGQTAQTGQSGSLTLAAQAGIGGIHLSWNGAGDSSVIGYNLYKGTVSGVQSTTPETDFAITGTSYDDTKIQNGVTYYYVLKPVFQDGSEGNPSNEVAATAGSGGKIVLTLGSPMMMVNGVSKEIDPGQGTVPVIKNQRTFIPIRAVIEEMGGTVGWTQAEQKVTITLGNNQVELWIGRTAIRVNGEQKSMDVAPYVSSTNRTMLPVRFVTENLGLNVDWNSVNQSVTIFYTNSSTGESKTDTSDNKTPANNATSGSWEGVWDTDFGDMTLHQAGSNVSGTYMYNDHACLIQGTVSGSTLTGTFDEGEGDTGVFKFTIGQGGQYFTGTWHYSWNSEWNNWGGSRK